MKESTKTIGAFNATRSLWTSACRRHFLTTGPVLHGRQADADDFGEEAEDVLRAVGAVGSLGMPLRLLALTR